MAEFASLRVDKWLWAARFFKTRSLATTAIHAGHVKLNGTTIKPARELRVGDVLEVRAGDTHFTVVIQALAVVRRPAPEARLLYAETEESQAHRAAASEMRRLAPVPGSELRGRPTKKARRLIHGFNTAD